MNAFEEFQKRMEDARRRTQPRRNKKVYKFMPVETMFKLEERDKAQMGFDPAPRNVVCVNCAVKVPLHLYFANIVSPPLEQRCSSCKVTAKEFWKGKLCRKVSNA